MVPLETLPTPVIHFPLASHTTKLSSSINASLQGASEGHLICDELLGGGGGGPATGIKNPQLQQKNFKNVHTKLKI
jgi:hypothetical protein